jgi:hypothetical protein
MKGWTAGETIWFLDHKLVIRKGTIVRCGKTMSAMDFDHHIWDVRATNGRHYVPNIVADVEYLRQCLSSFRTDAEMDAMIRDAENGVRPRRTRAGRHRAVVVEQHPEDRPRPCRRHELSPDELDVLARSAGYVKPGSRQMVVDAKLVADLLDWYCASGHCLADCFKCENIQVREQARAILEDSVVGEK